MQTYILKSRKEEANNVVTLEFVNNLGEAPAFGAGQYINIYFPDLNTKEGKAYSISSAPGQKTFSITVKAIGKFSNKLHALKIGDTIDASLPYGFFGLDNYEGDIVLIAGGIGVAPFRSIINDILLTKETKQKVILLHSVGKLEDRIFLQEFRELEKKFKNFSVKYFVTRDKGENKEINFHRISAPDIQKIVRNTSSNFLICGSISFVRDIWKALREQKVLSEQICTEAFF